MSEIVYTDPIYNDTEFKVEDAFEALLGEFQDYLPPVVVSLASEELETAHVAIICDELNSDDLIRNGNWEADVRLKVVTLFDETLPDGFASLRALHRQRCAVVRDNVMIRELATTLSTDSGITVQGFSFPSVKQRVEGRSWITEFYVKLNSVSGVEE
jgi:hypothetical protein